MIALGSRKAMCVKVAFSMAIAATLFCVTDASAQDVEAGKLAFRKCSACHADDAKTNKVGPHLADVIGRKAGGVEGYTYSEAMKDAGEAGLVWNEATLAEYLAAPRTKVPGTKMAFAGIKKPEELQNLVAYLKSLSDAQ